MAFEELSAQTEVMDKLSAHASAIKSLTLSNPLLNDARYAKARASIDEAAGLLTRAQLEIGTVERLAD
jgi:hypothetical protein